uniref:Uncharacterized protein n=1 Tax=Rhizophora mucronata TaxID=61149 RepID=A0A2P2QQC0_RHIMU
MLLQSEFTVCRLCPTSSFTYIESFKFMLPLFLYRSVKTTSFGAITIQAPLLGGCNFHYLLAKLVFGLAESFPCKSKMSPVISLTASLLPFLSSSLAIGKCD